MPEPDHDPPRRLLNVVVAACSLVLLLPLMLCIAAVIRCTSPGPALYVQPRVGLDRRRGFGPAGNHRRYVDHGGRVFTIYKFRTMYVAPGSAELWAAPGDPRVTPVGAFLRRTRLDELPQLYNVLKGDMNIVGPRPEQPGIFMRLREQIDGYGDRQRVLPGITGWAQINQHYDSCMDDVRRKLELDLQYIHRRSIRADLRIMARTIPVILFQRGAW